MQVILQKEVQSLGREGDVVKVAGGYANNFLIPKGLAIMATAGNLKQLEQRRSSIAKREVALKSDAEAEAAKLEGKSVTITVKAGAEGRLYGSITTKDIAAAIEEQLGLAVDRRRIEHSHPIKQTGNFMLKVKLYPEVEPVVEVKVRSDQAEPEAMAAEAESVEAAVEEVSADSAVETESAESAAVEEEAAPASEDEEADEDEA